MPENVETESDPAQSKEPVIKDTDDGDNQPNPVLQVGDVTKISLSKSVDSKVADLDDDATKNESAKTDSDVKEMFTDDMIDKLEQSEDVADAGDLANLLDGTDELMFRTNGQNGMEKRVENGIQNGAKEERENDARRSDVREATSLLLQGKRNMIVEDYESAVETLAEACEKFTALFGELGDECGEVYLTYATALIELARLKEKEKEEEETDGNEEVTENDDTKTENKPENGENGSVEVNGEDEIEEQNGAVNGEVANGDGDDDEDEKGEENDEKAEGNESDDEDEEEVDTDEEIDNFEIAWQILELSKCIYARLCDKNHLSTVHTRLGEVSLSSGNYDLAIEDLKHSLEIQDSLPSVSIRYKAVNHFNLYLAYKSKFCFEEADRELYALKSCCETRLEELEDKLESLKKEANKEFEIKKVTAEIQESKDVLKEVNEKFEESRKEKRGLYQKVSDAILSKAEILNRATGQSSSSASTASSNAENSFSSFVSSKSDVPVNNISHLVRKKKKVTFEQSEDSSKNIQDQAQDSKSNKDKAQDATRNQDQSQDSKSSQDQAQDATRNPDQAQDSKSNPDQAQDSKSDVAKPDDALNQPSSAEIAEKPESDTGKLSSDKSEKNESVEQNSDTVDSQSNIASDDVNCADSVFQSEDSCNGGKRKADEDLENPAKKLCSELA